MEDREIVELFWRRDENAIFQAEAKYGRYCGSIAAGILRDRGDTDECLNDTWMNAWNSMPPHRPQILSAFLGKITRFLALKKLREKNSLKRGGGEVALAFEELAETIPDGRDFRDELQAKELAEKLNEFLAGIGVTERRIFIRRYWYLEPISAISESLGFSRSKVKTDLWRTRAKLRTHLIKEGVFDES